MSFAGDTVSGRGAVVRNALYLVLGQAMTTALAILFSACSRENSGCP